jgi:hypothetical protein
VSASGTAGVGDSGIAFTNWMVTKDNTTTSITNTSTGKAFWCLTLQFTDSATGTPAVQIRRTGVWTNTISPLAGSLVGIVTNTYWMPVAGVYTNFVTDVSTGSGASITVLDSHIEQ